MPDVLLANPAAADFKALSAHDRRRVLKLLRNIQDSPAKQNPVRIRSAILDTSLFMIRAARLRLVYEINAGRAVVLAIQQIKATQR